MMRKKIVSLCMALALCLGLLPVTALAVGEDVPGTLWVGQTQITTSGYWKTNSDGTLTTGGAGDDNYNVYYDGNGTLTLNNATIQGRGNSSNTEPHDYGIYAAPTGNQSVSLTIKLIGSNTVSGYSGIYVGASYGDSTLVIQSDTNGSLKANGSGWNGITISSDSGNASLTINNASVVANSEKQSSHGVSIKSRSSTKLSLTVNGGSLTAKGTYGIFYSSLSGTNPSTFLTVSDSALIKAIPSIYASVASIPAPKADSESGGIVFDGTEGTVYGDVTLDESLTIGEGETLTIPGGSSLNANGKLTNDGTINVESGGNLEGEPTSGSGTVVKAPTITTPPTNQSVTVGQTASFTVEANGDSLSYQWQQSADNGTNWKNISGATSNSYTTDAATLEMNNYQYQCVVSNSAGSVTSSAATLTVNAATVPVTGVTLEPKELSLYTGQSETLAATVQPEDATNQSVTWKSSDDTIATVDSTGKVTAVSAGTATITVTTEDGGKTATCTVTVKHGNMVHTPKKDATCTEAGHTEYWTCETCGKMFRDENGTNEISQESTVIPATGHTFRGGWCAVCGARDPNYVPPANPNYRVDVTTTEGGTVAKDPAAAKAGETVTLTPAPDAGFDVGTVTVTDRFGDTVDVTANPDGTYTFTMPNGQVKVEVTFVEVQPEPLPFTDVSETDWFHDAVRYVYDNGLMDGVGDGQFAPNATTNRAMVVTILYRLAGEPDVSGDVGFTDVAAGQWYTDAVAWAAQKGIVNGISETEFAPAGDLTREQLATILFRYAESAGYDVSAQADLSGFPDAGDIQSYATQALSWAVAEGLLQGFEDDSLQPGGTATRAQIAAILMRFLAAAPTA